MDDEHIDVVCTCGDSLDIVEVRNDHIFTIIVKPCVRCLDGRGDEQFDQGRAYEYDNLSERGRLRIP